MKLFKNLPEALLDYRKRKNISQAKAAEKIGSTTRYWQKLEKDEVDVSLTKLMQLCRDLEQKIITDGHRIEFTDISDPKHPNRGFDKYSENDEF